MGQGEVARYEQFLLFPQCFLPVWRTFCSFHQIRNYHLQALSVGKSLKSVIDMGKEKKQRKEKKDDKGIKKRGKKGVIVLIILIFLKGESSFDGNQ